METSEVLKTAKSMLENEVTQLVADFEEQTGLTVNWIEFEGEGKPVFDKETGKSIYEGRKTAVVIAELK